MNSVSFTPVTITAETLQVLAKEKNYANLLALYMACVEIAVWQKNNNIKATRDFMMKRLGWGEEKLGTAKATLIKLGLLENIARKDSSGKVVAHYVLVKHIIQNPLKPGPGFGEALVSGSTNTNDLQKSTNDLKESAAKAATHQNEKVLELFEFYKKEFGVTKTLLTPGRKQKLALRLKTCGFDLVRSAIAKTAASPWHRGQNDRGWKANIDFIIRSDEQVERLADMVVKAKRLSPEEKSKLQKEFDDPNTTPERKDTIEDILIEQARLLDGAQ